MRKLLILLFCLIPSLAFAEGIDSYVVFMSHYSGVDGATTATDESDSNHTITFNNNAEIDTAIQKMCGSSLLLDGTDDYTSCADSDDWDILPTGAEVFTIDFWVYFDTTGSHGLISAHGANGTDDGWVFWIDHNVLKFVYNGGDEVLFSHSWVPSTSTWYHLAVEKWDADDWSLYIDGTEVDTDVNSTAMLDDTALAMWVGYSYNYSSGRWNSSIQWDLDGNIDEPRISKGIARYGGENFTAPTSKYTRGNPGALMRINYTDQ